MDDGRNISMDCIFSDTPASVLRFPSVTTVLMSYRRTPSSEQGDKDAAGVFRGEGSQSLEINLSWFKNKEHTEKLSKCGKTLKTGKSK